MVYYLKEALKEAQEYRRFQPSVGYSWDFGESEDKASAKEAEEAEEEKRMQFAVLWSVSRLQNSGCT